MGNRDKGNRETKKPKKSVKENRPLTSGETYSATVDVVPRKRKVRDEDES